MDETEVEKHFSTFAEDAFATELDDTLADPDPEPAPTDLTPDETVFIEDVRARGAGETVTHTPSLLRDLYDEKMKEFINASQGSVLSYVIDMFCKSTDALRVVDMVVKPFEGAALTGTAQCFITKQKLPITNIVVVTVTMQKGAEQTVKSWYASNKYEPLLYALFFCYQFQSIVCSIARDATDRVTREKKHIDTLRRSMDYLSYHMKCTTK